MCLRRNILRFGNPCFPVQALCSINIRTRIDLLVQLPARGDLALRTTSMQATVVLHVRIFTHRYPQDMGVSAALRFEPFVSLFKLRRTLLRHQFLVLLPTSRTTALDSSNDSTYGKSFYHTAHTTVASHSSTLTP